MIFFRIFFGSSLSDATSSPDQAGRAVRTLLKDTTTENPGRARPDRPGLDTLDIDIYCITILNKFYKKKMQSTQRCETEIMKNKPLFYFNYPNYHFFLWSLTILQNCTFTHSSTETFRVCQPKTDFFPNFLPPGGV